MKVNKSRLDCAMANSGVTISDIRKETGTSSITFVRLKRGENVRPDVVGKIAKALNVTAEYLTEGA